MIISVGFARRASAPVYIIFDSGCLLPDANRSLSARRGTTSWHLGKVPRRWTLRLVFLLRKLISNLSPYTLSHHYQILQHIEFVPGAILMYRKCLLLKNFGNRSNEIVRKTSKKDKKKQGEKLKRKRRSIWKRKQRAIGLSGKEKSQTYSTSVNRWNPQMLVRYTGARAPRYASVSRLNRIRSVSLPRTYTLTCTRTPIARSLVIGRLALYYYSGYDEKSTLGRAEITATFTT